MTEKTTAQEVREAEAAAEADNLTHRLEAITTSLGHAERDPGLAAEGMSDEELAEYVALLQDARYRLGLVERDLTVALGQRLGKATGALADGRQFTLQRSTDRKEWAHDDWKRDARRAIVQAVTEDFADPDTTVAVAGPEGEVWDIKVAALIGEALLRAQEVHGAQAPKSTALKALGLYASDYCTSSPAGWRFSAVKPTTKEDTTDD